jgi:hypothetical protein
MWAMLDKDNETVLCVFPPDVDIKEMLSQSDGYRLIKMTIENSPAYLNGKYKDGKFYPKESEKTNG